MYTADNYFWGLVAYYVGALIVIWYIYWLLARVSHRHIRNTVALLFVAILITPVQAYPDPQLHQLAPAFLVYLFEGLVYTNQQEPVRGLLSILLVYLLLLIGYGGWLWWQYKWRGTKMISPELEKTNAPESEKINSPEPKKINSADSNAPQKHKKQKETVNRDTPVSAGKS